ncbi:MAG: lipopolysaccharide assembly protein LapA domain-containing protein [Rhodoplanes sp.]
MIRRALAVLILGPLAVLIVALAVANRQTVAISFDPFNAADPAYRVQLPLFLLVFLLVIAGVLIGGIAAWLKQSRWRRRSRRFEAQLHRAEAEIGRLRRRVGGATGDATASPGQAEGGAAVAERPVDTRPPPQWPPPRALPPAA